MLSPLTNCGPPRKAALVRDNDDDETGEIRPGDQAHMAAPANGALLAKRTPRRITRAGWIFWGVVLTPVLVGSQYPQKHPISRQRE